MFSVIVAGVSSNSFSCILYITTCTCTYSTIFVKFKQIVGSYLLLIKEIRNIWENEMKIQYFIQGDPKKSIYLFLLVQRLCAIFRKGYNWLKRLFWKDSERTSVPGQRLFRWWAHLSFSWKSQQTKLSTLGRKNPLISTRNLGTPRRLWYSVYGW